MKLRNILAVGLLVSQCGCGHTYFAWSKPLPVEQTEVHPLPAAGMFDWNRSVISQTDLLRSDNQRDVRKAFEKSLGEAMRTHGFSPKR